MVLGWPLRGSKLALVLLSWPLWFSAEELLYLLVQLLVTSLGLVSAVFRVPQPDLQRGHTALLCVQG